jgi:hypothetical protein
METLKSAKTPVRITYAVRDLSQGNAILQHLTEERLVSGGTVIQATSVNWVGGKIEYKNRLELTAYTLFHKLPLIQSRIAVLYETQGEEIPILSQFVLTNEKETTVGWIMRNVR